ncbi:MAG: ABC transporter permease, partial [Acidobacteriota bacterium]|nr:ABC transporter permease [Acidobacteriota bacterium]
MNRLWQDLRYAARMLRARPAFTLAATLSLALGIGACAAIFSIVDAVLLRSLPFPEASRIVELRETNEKRARMAFTDPNYEDVRARNHSFEAIAEYSGGSAQTMTTTITGGSEPVRAPVYAVSEEFFRVLGVAPLVGRAFLPGESKSGSPVAVVSYGFWRRELGGKSDLAGTTLRIENQSFQVVGVLPPSLGFPKAAEVWVPREMFPVYPSRTAHNWSVIARLRPGVTLDAARSDLSTIGHQIKQENGAGVDANDFAVIPLQEYLVGNARQALLIILAAVGFLLLVASTNVANLLLAQMTARQREFAVRTALGAGRLRLAQQFLTENLLLTLFGGAFGMLLSFWCVDLILKLNQGSLPRADEISVNARALLFTLALAALIAVVLGLVSVFHVAGEDLQTGLREAARGQTSHGKGKRLRGFLVVAQVALTLILLVGAGLLGKSFVKLLRVDPGFRTDSAVVMNLSLPASEDKDQQKRNALFYEQLLERFQQLPGVTAVGGINGLPMTDTGADGTFLIDNDPSHTGHAEYRLASSGYFAAMGIPLVRGRLFGPGDTPEAPPAAVISQSLAQKYFPGEDPVGKQIILDRTPPRALEIVGVVGDLRYVAPALQPFPEVYVSYLADPWFHMSLAVRSSGDPTRLVAAVRAEVAAMDRDVPLANVKTMEQYVSDSFGPQRFSAWLLALFAGAALALAALGVYGVMA